MQKHVEYRIFGPPGTGKTTTLGRYIARAVEAQGPDRVIVASFTRAAAAELVRRDLPVARENVGTLHALCYRLLGRPPIAETRIKEWNESVAEPYRITLEDPDIDDPHAEPVGFDGVSGSTRTNADACFMRYQLLRARMVPRSAWPSAIREFAQRWEDWKTSNGYMDFTDLIETSYLDHVHPNVNVGFFDEAQDFTALELALIRRWAEKLDYVVLCGDDDQAIYEWKGASPDVLISGEPDRKIVLDRSYRVPRTVQTKALQWIELVGNREPKVYRPRDAEGEVRYLRASLIHVKPLVEDIERQIVASRTVMVLATCSYMLAGVVEALRSEGIPFWNPYRKRRGDWNPLTPTGNDGSSRVSTAARLLAYLRPRVDVWGSEARMWTPQDLKLWTELVRADGVLRRGARAEIDRMGGTDEVSIDVLIRLFEPVALDRAFDCDLDWLLRHATKQRRSALEYVLRIFERRGGAALRETPRVTVGTIHSVKGGEADVVYLFPDLSHAGYLHWNRPGAGRDAIRRLFYVGMTRARHSLVLCAPTRWAVPL